MSLFQCLEGKKFGQRRPDCVSWISPLWCNPLSWQRSQIYRKKWKCLGVFACGVEAGLGSKMTGFEQRAAEPISRVRSVRTEPKCPRRAEVNRTQMGARWTVTSCVPKFPCGSKQAAHETHVQGNDCGAHFIFNSFLVNVLCSSFDRWVEQGTGS